MLAKGMPYFTIAVDVIVQFAIRISNITFDSKKIQRNALGWVFFWSVIKIMYLYILLDINNPNSYLIHRFLLNSS